MPRRWLEGRNMLYLDMRSNAKSPRQPRAIPKPLFGKCVQRVANPVLKHTAKRLGVRQDRAVRICLVSIGQEAVPTKENATFDTFKFPVRSVCHVPHLY